MKGFLNGFRKWSMAIIFLAVAVVLLVFEQVPSVDWMDNVSEVMVAFMATNVGEHILNVTKEWVKGKNFGEINTLLGKKDAK